jgi:hypothetical protein
MDKLVEETIADGRWFPLRYKADQFYFAFIPPERHRETSFLVHIQPPVNEMRAIPRSSLAGLELRQTDLHFILHLGFGGSTLLGKLLAQPGVAITFQEPPVVTDIVRAAARRGGSEDAELVQETARLLARPVGAGEANICKMTHVGNALAAAMAEPRPGSRILCLQTPIEEMLLSLASRGHEGRISARKIAVSLYDSDMGVGRLTDRDLAEHTDLQLAALAWLSMQKMMVDASLRLGPQRAGSIVTSQLMESTGETLGAVAGHFSLRLDVDGRLAEGLLQRHSKTGEPFSAEQRAERVADGLKTHSAEIAPVVDWARKVAERAAVPWELPYPLIS